jgi:hypothetical protein
VERYIADAKLPVETANQREWTRMDGTYDVSRFHSMVKAFTFRIRALAFIRGFSTFSRRTCRIQTKAPRSAGWEIRDRRDARDACPAGC